MSSQREQFEQWALSQGLPVDLAAAEPGKMLYDVLATRAAWAAWKAAQSALVAMPVELTPEIRRALWSYKAWPQKERWAMARKAAQS